jgi:hypothetical protein
MPATYEAQWGPYRPEEGEAPGYWWSVTISTPVPGTAGHYWSSKRMRLEAAEEKDIRPEIRVKLAALKKSCGDGEPDQ